MLGLKIMKQKTFERIQDDLKQATYKINKLNFLEDINDRIGMENLYKSKKKMCHHNKKVFVKQTSEGFFVYCTTCGYWYFATCNHAGSMTICEKCKERLAKEVVRI